jgi:regulator of replication initiation timing
MTSRPNVGARVEHLGGPKTQSLRNKNGSDFRRLIDGFAAAQGKHVSKKTKRPSRPIDEVINSIDDFNARTSLRLILVENAQLKHENDQLRSAFSEMSVDLSRGESNRQRTTRLARRMPASRAALEAFTTFLSDEWLSRLGFETRPDGSIFDVVAGQLVAPAGFSIGLADVLNGTGNFDEIEAEPAAQDRPF